MSEIKISIWQLTNNINKEGNLNSPKVNEIKKVKEVNEIEEEKEVKKAPKVLISLSKEIEEQKEISSTNKYNEIKKINDNKNSHSINIQKNELFKNYNSDFQKNEKNILQRIRNLRFIPRTRIWLLISLISFTILSITLLFIIDPKHNSLSVYKTNIITIIWKNKENLTKNQNNINNQSDNVSIMSWSDIDIDSDIESTSSWNIVNIETNSWDILTSSWNTNTDETINPTSSGADDLNNEYTITERWLKITPEVTTLPNWDKVYMYKWNTYSKESLQNVLKLEVKEEIDKKIKSHLNEIYLK